jgi:predicted alpha/beta-fold hydrolase
VALDWLEDGCPASAPIIIILPGLTGDSQTQYVRCLLLSANRMKLRTVVFNYRGLGGMSLKVKLETTFYGLNENNQIYILDNLLSGYSF